MLDSYTLQRLGCNYYSGPAAILSASVPGRPGRVTVRPSESLFASGQLWRPCLPGLWPVKQAGSVRQTRERASGLQVT